MTEAEKLLKEARKILLASSLHRTLNKDFIQRVNDHFKKQEKKNADTKES